MLKNNLGKSVVKSVTVCVLILSVSIFTPLINSQALNINDDRYGNEAITVEPSYEKEKRLINSIYKGDLPADYFIEFMNYFNIFNIKGFSSISSIKGKIISIHNELFDIIKNKKSFNEASSELKGLLDIFERYNISMHRYIDQLSSLETSDAWEDYLYFYQRATTIWSGEYTYEDTNGRWGFLFLFKFLHSENNYYDWSTKIVSKIDLTYYASIVVGIVTIPTLAFVPFEDLNILTNIIVGILLALTLLFDYNLASYVHNGNEFMQQLQDREVDILIHVGKYENGTFEGINNLHLNHGIEAINTDAIAWANKNGNESTGRDKNLFTYYLGSADGIEGEDGWYTLKNRHTVDGHTDPLKRYKKAPCPPGNWNITIHGNSQYQTETIESIEIDSGDIVILDNVTLKEH